MAKKENKLKTYFIYASCVFLGVLVELLGIRFEEVMMRMNFQAKTGFTISLLLLIFSPFLSTGYMIYRYTGELGKAVLLAALVFPLTLIIFLKIIIPI